MGGGCPSFFICWHVSYTFALHSWRVIVLYGLCWLFAAIFYFNIVGAKPTYFMVKIGATSSTKESYNERWQDTMSRNKTTEEESFAISSLWYRRIGKRYLSKVLSITRSAGVTSLKMYLNTRWKLL